MALRAWYSSLLRELFRLLALPAPWHVLWAATIVVTQARTDGRRFSSANIPTHLPKVSSMPFSVPVST
jgi:hypothetical protein